MDLGLSGLRVVVTGAAQGIGLAAAHAFLDEGAQVLLVDRNPEVEAAAKACGGDALVLDIGAEDAALQVADAAWALGGCRVLVNNAGISRPGYIETISDLDWSDVMRVNIDAAFRLTRAVWPQLVASGGCVVNLASFAAKRATLFGNNAAYTVSKHAIAGLTRAAAMDGAGKGVRVNAVAPGVVSTEMVKLHSEETRGKIQGMIPLGRYAQPSEIADVIVFLASRRASHITGEVVNVNGGLVMD